MDIRLQKIRDEIINHPERYTGKSDLQIAEIFNTVGLYGDTKLRGIIPASEIFEAIVITDYDVLSTAEKDRCKLLLSLQQIDVSKPNIQDAFKKMFAAGTQTRTNLLALVTVSISRAEALGCGSVTHEDVIKALRDRLRRYKVSFEVFSVDTICGAINTSIIPVGMTYLVDANKKDGLFRIFTLGELPSPFEEVI